jgi:hypothetical protein
VELKAIEPPLSVAEAMQKQMRADREKRAVILQSEGAKQSAILTAEGEKQAAVLRARGEAEATVVRAEADATAQAKRAQGEAQAIATVFRAIHEGNPDQSLLAYRYLQTLPQIAQGDANKVWIVPSEIGRALDGIGSFFSAGNAGARTSAEAAPARHEAEPDDRIAIPVFHPQDLLALGGLAQLPMPDAADAAELPAPDRENPLSQGDSVPFRPPGNLAPFRRPVLDPAQ